MKEFVLKGNLTIYFLPLRHLHVTLSSRINRNKLGNKEIGKKKQKKMKKTLQEKKEMLWNKHGIYTISTHSLQHLNFQTSAVQPTLLSKANE
jgi:hypothetical protein